MGSHSMGKHLVDWTSVVRPMYEESYTCHFDRLIRSSDGSYAFLYQIKGTKGLILRADGSIIREVNRSYYHSSTYEYPATFWKRSDGITCLIHCPEEYNRIEIEEVETGKRISDESSRKPSDAFHSRLMIDPDNRTLLSRGWYWHPWDCAELFDLEDCSRDPKLLDQSKLTPDVMSEVTGADFIDENRILLGYALELDNVQTKEEKPSWQIVIWNFRTGEISEPVTTEIELGTHLFVIDENRAWDLYGHPKIIDIHSGNVMDSVPEINSGTQQSSIIHHLNFLPKIAFNRETGQVAIGTENTIEILTP